MCQQIHVFLYRGLTNLIYSFIASYFFKLLKLSIVIVEFKNGSYCFNIFLVVDLTIVPLFKLFTGISKHLLI